MKLHHLTITCNDALKAKIKFTSLYSFKAYGYLVVNKSKDIIEVLRHGDIFILLKQSSEQIADTVDDVAFVVEDLETICQNTLNNGSIVVQSPRTESCQTYSGVCKPCKNCKSNLTPCLHIISKAIVKSPIGNLQHTILNKTNFHGDFLPGFVSYEESLVDQEKNNEMFDCIDHVALAVPCGETMKHIMWYKECLQLFNFYCNRLEKDDSLVIRSKMGQGIRLYTLVAHPCSEAGLITEEHEIGNERFKFVFCESLELEGKDQINSFLKKHNGPGVQHVAFKSSAIVQDTKIWHQNGVKFLSPPIEYYNIIDTTLNKLETRQSGLSSSVQDLGILIDVEKISNTDGDKEEEGFLYQVFTSPILPSETFFFELIQRENSHGFGAGNVAALWNAVEMSNMKGIR
ncbi:putative protein C31H2.4 [Clytia hemisphaerica]|uniref:4-hydroxyphenylpyruvate dioxygenase n=1 Tax=Clytia hemisphaerica TaxID=252671 RepID=A0A7M5UFY3_9CNID